MNKLLKSNYHFVWVVIFFILHGLNEFGRSVSLQSVLIVFFTLFFVGWVLFILYSKFTSDKLKAGVFASMLLMIIVFFGAVQDFLATYKFSARFASLPYLLPITCFFLVIFFLWLRFKKTISGLFVRYINLLFLLFILLETTLAIAAITFFSNQEKGLAAGLKKCGNCKKPPVYLVILDQYAGKHTLQKEFNFDNTFFYKGLSKKGFHIVDSSVSNYRRTFFSMASMLNMDYLEPEELLLKRQHYSFRKALLQIKTNPVTDFFSTQGYEIRNYSFFDLKDAPALVQNDLWGGNIRFFISQTIYGRIKRSFIFFLAAKNISNFFMQQVENEFINQINTSLAESVERERQNAEAKPVFTYIHLNIPHAPYLLDSAGKRVPEKTRRMYSVEQRQAAYLQYMVYCNKRILKWIDEIQMASKGNAVILLMSDHGAEPSLSNADVDKRKFDNLNAVYIPGADYSKWYKGFSNVNQFRLVLNELFKQDLPLKLDINPLNNSANNKPRQE